MPKPTLIVNTLYKRKHSKYVQSYLYFNDMCVCVAENIIKKVVSSEEREFMEASTQLENAQSLLNRLTQIKTMIRNRTRK